MDIGQLIKHPELMDKETLYDLRSLLALYPYYQIISDAHEWINEIPTVPIYYLANPQPRERAVGSLDSR